MNPPRVRRPKWYEKLDWVTEDGRGIVGYRWYYYPLKRLYDAIYFALELKEPDE